MTRMSPLLNNLVGDSRLITVQNARIYYSSVCSFHHHLFLVKCDFSSTSLHTLLQLITCHMVIGIYENFCDFYLDA